MANETYKELQFAQTKEKADSAYIKSNAMQTDLDGIKSRFGDKIIDATYENGYYLNQMGNRVPNADTSLRCTDYVEVDSGDKIKYKGKGGTSNALLCTYDKDKRFITCEVPHTGHEIEGTLTVGAGVKYIIAHSTTSTDYYCKVESFGYSKMVSNVNAIQEKVDGALGDFRIQATWLDFGSNLPKSKMYGTGTRSESEDGVTYNDGIQGAETHWVAMGLSLPRNFVLGHKYFIALELELIEDTTAPKEGSTQGNKTYSSIDLRSSWNTNTVITASKKALNDIITKGNVATLKWIFTTATSSPNEGSSIRLQFGSYNTGNRIEYKFKNACVIDMTEQGYETDSEAEAAFAKYGFNHADIVQKVYNIKVESAVTADNGGTGGTGGGDTQEKATIELWGDSLVGQGYGSKYLAGMLGRTVVDKGFGGKKSTYIRDQFLQQANINNTIIINVGRNNYFTPDVVIQDIKRMVAKIPHSRFLICTPPNGNYGEGVGTAAYAKFEKIRDRILREFPANSLDTWGACIEDYDMGGVTLLEPFSKPSIGNSVTIKVSDVEFLTSYNANDVTRWGEQFMSKIVVGQQIDAVDIYKVISHNATEKTITIELAESGSGIAIGSQVANGVDDGGSNSVIYLRVLQYADWYCYTNDIGQSTFRSDGIHMSERGMECLSRVVARKVDIMGI